MEPLNRRGFLRTASLAGLTWMTPLGHMLARASETDKSGTPAKSVIMLWMQGGPSQLETFDPHPGKKIGGDAVAINTAVKGIQIAKGLERVAEQMNDIAIVRSLMSKEGDHERGTYTLKTGFRPDPTLVHPAIGSILCHELEPGKTEIPRHVSILSSQWPARGGYLGDQFDAFRMDDPAGPVPDTQSFLPKERDDRRLAGLDVVEKAFAQGRAKRAEATLHRATMADARKMMTSEQLQAFNVALEPQNVRKAYGETPFGRGCLAARRLIEVGVRCVEVTLSGWDSHANNHEIVTNNLKVLDPAYSALLKDLRDRKLLDNTMVIWAGEFGRTPIINALGGRDHWPHSFSVTLAGGDIQGGQVLGETDPEGGTDTKDPIEVGDLHATILNACGVDYTKLNQTKITRTIKFAEGKPVAKLVKKA